MGRSNAASDGSFSAADAPHGNVGFKFLDREKEDQWARNMSQLKYFVASKRDDIFT
jgi:hypothetical protein